MHLSPEGFRIRLMEPGEAEALRALGRASGLFAGDVPETADFVRWLLQHEVFVAETEEGVPAGFAVARDATDLYWLSGLCVGPAWKGRGIRKALLAAIVTRAGWFFHRAVGLRASSAEEADWYRRRRFLSVDRNDETPALIRLGEEAPGFPVRSADPKDEAEIVSGLVGTERSLMVHWL